MEEHRDEPVLGPGEPRSFGAGRYVVQRRLGAGNFATVFLAFDERLDVPVAVKVLSDRWSWDPEVRGRFVQEARLLRSLNDPRVVQIRDIAETDDGRPYLVMDLATRGTLEQRLAELRQQGVHLDAEQLAQAAHGIGEAVAVLHERRIAHRDLKPSNLLITTANDRVPDDPADQVRLLRRGERLMVGDLGLAKDLMFDSGITVGVGTAGYMAPEQSVPGGRIDTRTDIYAVSALLAQIVSGEPPDPVRRMSDGEVASGRPLPSSIPAPLAAVLARGLDVAPEARQATIEEWLGDVDRALAVTTLPDPLPPAPPHPPDRRRWFAGVALGVAVVGIGGAALLARGGDASSGAATTTTVAVTTSVAATVAPTTVAATTAVATTAASTAVAATTAAATVAPVTTAALTVHLDGPTSVPIGVPVRWNVTFANAVSGTWSLTGPVQPSPDTWQPGNWFEGTWNVAGTFELTLTVADAAGNTARDTITFTVA